MSPFILAVLRASLSTVIMTAFALLRGRIDVLRIRKGDVFPCLINGLFGVAVSSTSAAFAMTRIPIGLTFLLINTAPLWVMILARIFWGERISRRQLAALALGLGGVWVSVGGIRFQSYDVFGILAALGAGVGFAVYVVNGRYGMGRRDPLKAYVQMFLWGALSLWVALLLSGNIQGLLVTRWEAWLSLLYMTLFPGMAAFGILMLALRNVPGGVAAIVAMTEIPFAMLWSRLFLNESPDSNALKGGLLIVGAVVLLSTAKRGHTRPPSVDPPAAPL
jgi:drug/metabolite transporter (DMT)-like permease